MSWSSLYIQILISIAVATGTLILTIIDILPLRVLVGLVPILVLLAILRNCIDKRKTRKPKIPIGVPSLEEFTFVDPPGYYTHPKYPYPICQNCLIKSKLISPVSQIDENTWFCNICIKYFPGGKGEVFTVDW